MRRLIGFAAALALLAAPPAHAADTSILDKDAILAANALDERQWYKDNIPFLDTPDNDIDDVYYYRWSTYKRALRYTVPGTGYVSTEYDVPIGYAGEPVHRAPGRGRLPRAGRALAAQPRTTR